MNSLFSLALHNLRRHRIRTALTVVGIAVAALTLFCVLSFNNGYDRAVEEDISGSGVHLYVSREGCPLQAAALLIHGGEIPEYVDEGIMPLITEVEGVEEAGGFLIGAAVVDGTADLFHGITPEVAGLKPDWRLEGGWFEGDDSVILGAAVAEKMGKRPGDRIRVESLGEEFTVSGVLEVTNGEDDNFHFLPLQTAQRLFDKPGKLTAVGVRLADVMEMDRVKSDINRIPGAYVIPSEDMKESILGIVGGTKSIMFAILVIVLLVSGLGVFNTVLMATFERREEFGYMRCVGARRGHIFRLTLMETLLMSAAGLGAGMLAGYAVSSGIERWIRGFIAYVPSGRLMRPDPATLLLSAAVVLLIGLAAGLYPGYRASRVPPMEAIRHG